MEYKGKNYNILNEKQEGSVLYLALKLAEAVTKLPQKETEQTQAISKHVFSTRSLNTLKGVHPKMIKLMTEAISNSPIDFTLTDGVRTAEQQNKLYQKGRGVAGSVVTNVDGYKKKSNHQVKSDGYGHAVDLYPFLKGKVDVNADKELKIIATHIKAVAKKLGIVLSWGGDWKSFKDYPHFELA